MPRTALFALLLASSLAATGIVVEAQDPRPTFSAFPVKSIYRGKSAPPRITAEQRAFGTHIRTGARAPVQFAGHYTVALFACGTECSMFYIIDAISGTVYDGFAFVELPTGWIERQKGPLLPRIAFHPNSRLLKINGCPNERDCGFYDYLMLEGSGLKLIRKQLLPQAFQY